MIARTLDPLADVPISPEIAAVPKADLHLHQEIFPRLDRVIVRREGRVRYDWRSSARRMMASVPPGVERLRAIFEPDSTLGIDLGRTLDADTLTDRIADNLAEAAAEGAIYAEIRFNNHRMVTQSDLMAAFREAERRVQAVSPRFCAEAIGHVAVSPDAARHRASEEKLDIFLGAARHGLRGLDMIIHPYDATDDPTLWATAYRWAERATDAGLGITIHVGEFGTASVAAALRTPGLRRIGHGTHIASDPRLLDLLAECGATIECALTSNVVLGSAPSYEEHPIRRFLEYGIPLTLASDIPMHACTSIGREYAIAALLGLSPNDLIGCTRNAVAAAFTTEERRAMLLQELAE
jgi:adenosine deaminase